MKYQPRSSGLPPEGRAQRAGLRRVLLALTGWAGGTGPEGALHGGPPGLLLFPRNRVGREFGEAKDQGYLRASSG